jgi:hypothetical protein
MRNCDGYRDSGRREVEWQLQQRPYRIYAEIICGCSAQALLALCAATPQTFFAFSDLCREECVADRQSQITSIETATTHQRCDPGTAHATTFICSTTQVNCKDFTVREPRYHRIHNASLELLWPGLGDAKRRVRLCILTRKNSLTQCYCRLREWPGQ